MKVPRANTVLNPATLRKYRHRRDKAWANARRFLYRATLRGGSKYAKWWGVWQSLNRVCRDRGGANQLIGVIDQSLSNLLRNLKSEVGIVVGGKENPQSISNDQSGTRQYTKGLHLEKITVDFVRTGGVEPTPQEP